MLLLALAATVAAPIPSAEAEIVVLGRRQQTVRFTFVVDDKDGRLKRCRIIKSSGDAEIDQIGCEAGRLCVVELMVAPKLKRPPNAVFNKCLSEKRRALIEELADKRAAAN